MDSKETIDQFSTHLFWDVPKEKIELDKNAQFVIARVLEYGFWEDWKLTLAYYGVDKIVKEMKQIRSLDPVALAYICTISGTKQEEYRCYHFQQSNPTLWYF
jgi:hypothetical protein